MYRNSRNERNKKALYSKVLILVLLFLVFILSRAAWGAFNKSRDSRANLLDTTEDLDKLEERRALLEEDINSLNTEKGIDAEIREKFRVTEEGERMIMLIDSPSTTEEESNSQKEGFWSKIFSIF